MSFRSVEIRAEPDVSLVDDLVRIHVKGLGSNQAVTIAAFISEDNKLFVSYAFYYSDAAGRVDCGSMPSLGGTFDGVEAMGLFWSMKQGRGQKQGLQLIKRNMETPFHVSLYLYNGQQHIADKIDIAKHEKLLLAQTTLRRYYQSPEVRAIPVRDGSIRGMLYLPPGDGPFPGILNIEGAIGGVTKHRAALLASRGFAAMSLAYYGYEDLPPTMDLQMEYFEDAVEWLSRHPLVLKNAIGVVGASKGGTLALEIAIKCPKVKAVVCSSGPAFHFSGSFHSRGVPQFVLNLPANEQFRSTEEGLVFVDALDVNENNKQHVIPVETAKNTQFLLIHGGDDAITRPGHFQAIIERFEVHGKTNYEGLLYPKAGHFIDPPYMPFYRVRYANIQGRLNLVVCGGEAKAHVTAQEHSWRRLLSFLREQLLTPGGHINHHTSSKL